MSKAKKNSLNILKWNYEQFGKALIGCFLFAVAINLFIVPNGLYNGGVLGLAQLLRTVITEIFNVKLSFDISGIFNFLINVPLFILAFSKISKTFFARTLVCVGLQTIFLTFIPTLDTPLVNEIITSVLIGGIIAGYGCGLVLSAAGSGGGTDIIGILMSMKNRNLSVGKIGLTINAVIYSICGILFGLETMLYSILYTVFLNLMVDRTHDQNICSTALIFTKNKPTKILDFVKDTLKRDGTYWEAIGGYDSTKTYICYVVLSKYELQRLERYLPNLDQSAFVVKSDDVGINGNFKKELVDH